MLLGVGARATATDRCIEPFGPPARISVKVVGFLFILTEGRYVAHQHLDFSWLTLLFLSRGIILAHQV
eukprot:scaffold242220_cov18-Prasinocladus_malaysianus.AAC.1